MPKRRFLFLMAVMAVLRSPSLHASEPDSSRETPANPPIVIPFDFESTFDDGRYGRIVGDLIWKQLQRRGGTILPESMLDVRDWSASRKLVPGPDTPLDQMQTIVREDFGGDVGIWGKIERVAGFDTDVYDVWIRIADFSGATPHMLYSTQCRTKTVSEIPHVLIPKALDRIRATPPESRPETDPERELRWRDGPNLVAGDFEKGGRQQPVGWDPLPPHVSLQTVSDASTGHTRIVRFEIPQDVAATTGVLYYSDFFPVEENATYRFQCRWRSTGPQCKVFIKCYDTMPSRFQNRNSHHGRETAPAPGNRNASMGTPYDDPASQHREVYRSQQNLTPNPPARPAEGDSYGSAGARDRGSTDTRSAHGWHLHTEDFTPKHTQFTPRWGRVMLYAYWPAGTVEWDDIVVKQMIPPPKEIQPKIKRPSLETNVPTREIDDAAQPPNP